MNNEEEMMDRAKLTAPIKLTADKFELVPEFLKVRGLVKQHLDSFNYFINVGIKKIVHANNRITSTLDPSVYLRFKDVRVGEPTIVNLGIAETINPHMCRLADKTYDAPIYVNIEYVHGNDKGARSTCSYVAVVWKDLSFRILNQNYTTDWNLLIQLLTSQTFNKLSLFILRYLFQTMIYHIWKERNRRRHGETPNLQAAIIKTVDKTVRNRLSSIRRAGDHAYDESLSSWFSTR